MTCPKCNRNTLENQHNERLICLICAYNVESPGQSAASKDAFKAKIEVSG